MEPWDKMTGAELGSILSMPEHAAALQTALENARTDPQEADAQAEAIIKKLGVDPQFTVTDGVTNDQVTRVAVLTEELMRARFEEG